MDYLYSPYDALVSINIPGDKARAVVDAMERDMGTTLATKADLQLLATRAEVAELGQEIALVRKDVEVLGVRLDSRIDVLSTTMTLRLGSMLIVGLGLLFAALRLT